MLFEFKPLKNMGKGITGVFKIKTRESSDTGVYEIRTREDGDTGVYEIRTRERLRYLPHCISCAVYYPVIDSIESSTPDSIVRERKYSTLVFHCSFADSSFGTNWVKLEISLITSVAFKFSLE